MEHPTITTLTWTQFDTASRQIALLIPPSITNIYGIPRGGLIPAVRLSHLLSLPLTISPTDITATTLVVDDISDTGNTLLQLFRLCNCHTPTATLVYHPQSLVKPDIYIYTKGSAWVNFPWEAK